MKKMRVAVFACLLMASALLLGACSSAEQYQPSLPDATLTKPAIAKDGVLRVGVNTDKSPLAGLGNNKIIGIDVDIAAALADEFGLKLEVVDVGSDPKKAISDGEVDMVLGIDSTDKQIDIWKSDVYIPTGVALFALTSRNAPVPTATSKPEIAAQVSSKSAWAVTNTFGEDALSSTVDLATAFNDLASGDIEYVASDAIIGMYAANRQGVDVSIIALLEPAGGYCAGTATDNTKLQTALKDALNTLKNNGIIDVIETKWLGKPLDFDDIDVIESHKVSATEAIEAANEAKDAANTENTENNTANNTSNTATNTSSSSGNTATSNR